jgi:hypothetical protein
MRKHSDGELQFIAIGSVKPHSDEKSLSESTEINIPRRC